MKTKEEYIAFKIKRSDEALKQARLLLENGFHEAAISRLYYAVFYAVSALLINLDLNPKTHARTKSLFHKEFILSGRIEGHFADLYAWLMTKRFEVDYENFAYVDEKKVPSYIEEAERFIELVEEKLNLR